MISARIFHLSRLHDAPRLSADDVPELVRVLGGEALALPAVDCRSIRRISAQKGV